MRIGWSRMALFLVFCFLFSPASAQVTATISPIEMMIGEQAEMTIKVQASEGAKVEMPALSPRQMLIPGVEVINTRRPDNNTMVVTLTSFDGKLYYLPPVKVKVNGKESESKSLALKVLEVEVDTTQLNKMCPPKDVQNNPFMWSEWRPLFWLSVVTALLLALVIYLYLRLRSGKPIITHIKIVKRLLPHQKAMKEIELIKADKMIAVENQKEYYTKLTDTLRKYIEERYGFSAMEMTSSEIIARLMAEGDEQSLSELRQLFLTADLVKFAKYSTLANESDANLLNAIDFINQTKQENMPTEEVVKPQLSAEDQRSQKTRKVLRMVIGVIVLAVVALLAYVVYGICELML